MSPVTSPANPQGDRPAMPRPGGLNLKRRHLSEEQRAMVAGRLANLEEGRPEKTAQICAVSQSDAAELMGVSVPSVKRAVAVQRDGAPELIAAVRDDYATACGLTRSRVGKKCRCTKVYCTTVLVKGTSGHLKHRGGGISMSSVLRHNDLRRLTSRDD